MTAIAPMPPITPHVKAIQESKSHENKVAQSGSLTRMFIAIQKLIFYFDIGHKGAYSMDQLHQLSYYIKISSIIQAALVCLCNPLPVTVYVILIISMPMDTLDNGFYGHVLFWFRISIFIFIHVVTGIIQSKFLIPAFRISWCLIFSISLISLVVAHCANINATTKMGFPTSQTILLMSGLTLSSNAIISIRIRCTRDYSNNLDVSTQLRTFVMLMSIRTLLGIYAIMQKYYSAATLFQRTVIMLILPIIKNLMKNAVVAVTPQKSKVPTYAMFFIDVYHIAFIGMYLQADFSIIPTLVVISIDFIQNWIDVKDISEKLERLKEIRTVANSKMLDGRSMHLIEWVILITMEFPNPVNTSAGKNNAIHNNEKDNLHSTDPLSSSIPMHIIATSIKKNCEQTNLGVVDLSSQLISQDEDKGNLSSTTLNAGADKTVTSPNPGIGSGNNSDVSDENLIDAKRLATEILFQCECVLLLEYIEILVPFVYMAHLFVIYLIPNKQYFDFIAKMSLDEVFSMARSMLIYGVIEILNFISFVFILQRKLGFSPIYLLALVLKNEAVIIQTTLFSYLSALTSTALDKSV